MRAGRAPRIAGEGDEVSALNLLIGSDVQPGEVAVERLGVVPVVDDESHAELGLAPGEDHGSRRGGFDLRADRSADVDAAVEFRRLRPR
jgi:hypothetical protein